MPCTFRPPLAMLAIHPRPGTQHSRHTPVSNNSFEEHLFGDGRCAALSEGGKRSKTTDLKMYLTNCTVTRKDNEVRRSFFIPRVC